MNHQIVFAILSVIVFVGAIGLAIVGFWATGKANEKTQDPRRVKARDAKGRGGKGGARMVEAQRRRSLLPGKSDRRAMLLPPDATVTFADERQTAGIDDVLAAL